MNREIFYAIFFFAFALFALGVAKELNKRADNVLGHDASKLLSSIALKVIFAALLLTVGAIWLLGVGIFK